MGYRGGAGRPRNARPVTPARGFRHDGRHKLEVVPRSPISALALASSVVIIGSVVAMFSVRGIHPPGAAYGSLTCDVDGVCLPPDEAMPGIITGALAPGAFAVGLLGLLAAFVLSIVVTTWPPRLARGSSDPAYPDATAPDTTAPAERAGTAPHPVAAAHPARRVSSTDPHDAYRPPSPRGQAAGGR